MSNNICISDYRLKRKHLIRKRNVVVAAGTPAGEYTIQLPRFVKN
ncbi:hypothetical protein AB3G34_12910 [Flavobacterium sp. WC2409]|uniref:Uncharacterized protein n=1 Tax=Flavobacterium sp. WC2409 TaxID=3234139 RepID=A0AB39W016_9FLAO